MQWYTSGPMKRTDCMVHSRRPRRQTLSVWHYTDSITMHKRLATIHWAKHVLAFGHVKSSVAIGHQCQSILPLNF
jgi:hypothetical protein